MDGLWPWLGAFECQRAALDGRSAPVSTLCARLQGATDQVSSVPGWNSERLEMVNCLLTGRGKHDGVGTQKDVPDRGESLDHFKTLRILGELT
jgi:hypothetical protein